MPTKNAFSASIGLEIIGVYGICALAFQAKDAGSIPAARSSPSFDAPRVDSFLESLKSMTCLRAFIIS
jgi:hypothetical protein